jgi:hypothetical protein
MKERATQIRTLLNKLLMEVRNEGALYRLSLEDIRAHTKNPEIEAADVEEVADTIDGVRAAPTILSSGPSTYWFRLWNCLTLRFCKQPAYSSPCA